MHASVRQLLERFPAAIPALLQPPAQITQLASGGSGGDAAAVAAGVTVALVFGREESGLLESELLLCAHACAIPTGRSQPSLNLSHAVAVVASQLFDLQQQRLLALEQQQAAQQEAERGGQAPAEQPQAASQQGQAAVAGAAGGKTGSLFESGEPAVVLKPAPLSCLANPPADTTLPALSLASPQSGCGGSATRRLRLRARQSSRHCCSARQRCWRRQESGSLFLYGARRVYPPVWSRGPLPREISRLALTGMPPPPPLLHSCSAKESTGGGDKSNHGRKRQLMGHVRALALRSQASTAEVRALHGLCKELEARRRQ